MKKLSYVLLTAMVATAVLVGCGKNNGDTGTTSVSDSDVTVINLGGATTGDNSGDATDVPVEETREGMVRSELTNEWIDEELEDQRPIAVMVDNESTALDHYGLNQADIVYELVNSTANGWITRLMVIVKDYDEIEQLGSIRSARPTNFMLAAEYNAILVHDGGPVYINSFVSQPYTNNLSGGFARYSNGKASEYTEYVTAEGYTNPNTGNSYAGLLDRIDSANYSTTYNSYYEGDHFTFSSDENYMLSDKYSNATSGVSVTLPFTHNSSQLEYNETTGTYDYSEYGKDHIDPLDDNNILTFKNVIIVEAEVYELDSNGYMCYAIQNVSGSGYYLTNGECIPINWSKQGESGITYFTDTNGNPLELNTGKIYVAYSPTNHGTLTIE